MTTEIVKPHAGIVRLWNAYVAELWKARRRKFTYIGPLLVVMAVAGVAMGKKATEREMVDPYQFVAFATPLALNLLGLLLMLMFCASLVPAELGSGSVRAVVTRPIRRREFVLAKVLMAMTYACVLTLCVGVTAWVGAGFLAPLNGVKFGDELLFTGKRMVLAYVYGALLVLLPQFAAGAYAVMISTLTRSTGAAVGGSVGLWLLTDILKYPLGVEKYLFSTYLEMPWRVFVGHCNGLNPSWFPELWYCVLTSVIYFLAFTALACIVISRKDLRA